MVGCETEAQKEFMKEATKAFRAGKYEELENELWRSIEQLQDEGREQDADWAREKLEWMGTGEWPKKEEVVDLTGVENDDGDATMQASKRKSNFLDLCSPSPAPSSSDDETSKDEPAEYESSEDEIEYAPRGATSASGHASSSSAAGRTYSATASHERIRREKGQKDSQRTGAVDGQAQSLPGMARVSSRLDKLKVVSPIKPARSKVPRSFTSDCGDRMVEDDEDDQPQASTSKLPITSSSSRPVSYTSKTSRRPASPSSPIVNIGVMELLSDSDTSDLDDDNAPRRRSPSPELYGDQPPYPSSSTSPSGDESTRRSNRKTTQVEFVGNLVDHTPEMCRGVPVEPSPTKRRKVDKSYALSLGPKKGNGDGNGNGDGDGKGKGKRKEKAAEEEENSEVKLPFLPPDVALGAARLFDSGSLRTDPAYDLQKQLDEDDAPIRRLQKQLRRWAKAKAAKCEALGEGDGEYNLRRNTGKARTNVTKQKVETYNEANIGDVTFRAGDWVCVASDKVGTPWFAQIVYFHQAWEIPTMQGQKPGDLQVHVIWASTAPAAFNSKAAHPRHLLLLEKCESIAAHGIVCPVDVRSGTFKNVPAPSFFLSSLLLDNKSTRPVPDLDAPRPYCRKLEVHDCFGCEDRLAHAASHLVDKSNSAVPIPRWVSKGTAMSIDGYTYHLLDFIYLHADFDEEKTKDEDDSGAHWSGAQRPFRLAQLVSLDDGDDNSDGEELPRLRPLSNIRVRPFVRLGHIIKTEKREELQLVATSETVSVSLDQLCGKFNLEHGAAPKSPLPFDDTFYCTSGIAKSHDTDAATKKAILSAWARPPALNKPHTSLSVDLEPLIKTIDEPTWKECQSCQQTRRVEEERLKAAMKRMDRPEDVLKGLSTYSGLDLLAEGVGQGLPVKFKYAVEMDKTAAKICSINHPDTKVIHSCVSEVLEKWYYAPVGAPEREVLNVDVLVGGPPCQSFSRANQHKKKDDPRTLEIFVLLGFLTTGRPLYALIENVAALATHAHEEPGDVYGLVRDLLVCLGYDIQSAISNAAQFGLAQQRRRLLTTASKRGLPVPAVPEPISAVNARQTRIGHSDLDEASNVKTYFASSRRGAVHSGPLPATTVQEAFELEELPNFTGGEGPAAGATEEDLCGLSNNLTLGLSAAEFARVSSVGDHRRGDEWGDWRDVFGTKMVKKVRKLVDHYRRLWREEISATLLTELDHRGGNGARIHYSDDRVLSLAECCVLQGVSVKTILFPNARKGVRLEKKEVAAAYKLLGNAVAVPVAAAYGREAAKVLLPLVLDDSLLPARNNDDNDGSTLWSRLSAELDKDSSFLSKRFAVKKEEKDDDSGEDKDKDDDIVIVEFIDLTSDDEGDDESEQLSLDEPVEAAGPGEGKEIVVSSSPAKKSTPKKRKVVELELEDSDSDDEEEDEEDM